MLYYSKICYSKASPLEGHLLEGNYPFLEDFLEDAILLGCFAEF